MIEGGWCCDRAASLARVAGGWGEANLSLFKVQRGLSCNFGH